MKTPNRYLLLKGCAGLGNRLYTLCAAIEFALKTDRVLYVDWSDGQFDVYQENAFFKHFDLIDIPHIVVPDQLLDRSFQNSYPKDLSDLLEKGIYKSYFIDSGKSLRRLPSIVSSTGIASMVHGYWRKKGLSAQKKSESDWDSIKAMFSDEHFQMGQYLSKSRNEQVVVFADFCPPCDFTYFKKHVRLSQELRIELDRFILECNLQEAIGIHIRNTDKKPLSSFDRIRKSLPRFQFQSIFLATDDKSIETEIASWGYPLIVLPKFIPEDSSKGLHFWGLHNDRDDIKELMFKESVIDMYALARCKYLLYQENSSFSRLSHDLRGGVESSDWQIL